MSTMTNHTTHLPNYWHIRCAFCSVMNPCESCADQIAAEHEAERTTTHDVVIDVGLGCPKIPATLIEYRTNGCAIVEVRGERFVIAADLVGFLK